MEGNYVASERKKQSTNQRFKVSTLAVKVLLSLMYTGREVGDGTGSLVLLVCVPMLKKKVFFHVNVLHRYG